VDKKLNMRRSTFSAEISTEIRRARAFRPSGFLEILTWSQREWELVELLLSYELILSGRETASHQNSMPGMLKDPFSSFGKGADQLQRGPE